MNQLSIPTTTHASSALRDAGIAQVSMGREEWLAAVRAYARQVVATTGQVSINDLRGRFELPADASPNLWGAVFKSREFHLVGFDVANHPESHARRIGVYKTH